MKKFLKITALIVIVLFAAVVAFIYFKSEPLPEGKTGNAAEELTDKIQTAINQKAWESTAAVGFTFAGAHHYLWDKKNNLVQVSWGDTRVVYNNQTLEGLAFENGKPMADSDKIEAIQTANGYFNNDSFWLIAPFKLRDPGTTRSIVTIEGKEALMVTYSSGGSTPGDSYLWFLDTNFVPTSWRMWVSVLPIGGAELSWENWQTQPNGLKLATEHKGMIDLKITDIETGATVEAIANGENPFTDL